MYMHMYGYNSTFPLKSPYHLLMTSRRPPKGPFSNAAKQTVKQPRQFRLNVSDADSIKGTRFDHVSFDRASRNAFAVYLSALS